MSDAVEIATVNAELEMVNRLLDLMPSPELTAYYVNWRGEKDKRRIRPIRFWYGATEWHPQQAMLLKAMDLDRGVERDFQVIDFEFDTMSLTLKP